MSPMHDTVSDFLQVHCGSWVDLHKLIYLLAGHTRSLLQAGRLPHRTQSLSAKAKLLIHRVQLLTIIQWKRGWCVPSARCWPSLCCSPGMVRISQLCRGPCPGVVSGCCSDSCHHGNHTTEPAFGTSTAGDFQLSDDCFCFVLFCFAGYKEQLK